MSGPLLYIDTSDVREGALEELKGSIKDLVEFIDANEPQLLTYNVYLSDDGKEMTIAHVHADSSSLERHLEVGAPAFRKLADLIMLSSIRCIRKPTRATKP